MDLDPNLEYILGIININGNISHLIQHVRYGISTYSSQHTSHADDPVPAILFSMWTLGNLNTYSKDLLSSI